MDRTIEDAKQAYLDELAVGSLINSIKQMPALLRESRELEQAAEQIVKEARADLERYRAELVFLNQDKIAEGKNKEARLEIATGIISKNETYKTLAATVAKAEFTLSKARLQVSAVHDRFSAQKNQARIVTGILNYLA